MFSKTSLATGTYFGDCFVGEGTTLGILMFSLSSAGQYNSSFVSFWH